MLFDWVLQTAHLDLPLSSAFTIPILILFHPESYSYVLNNPCIKDFSKTTVHINTGLFKKRFPVSACFPHRHPTSVNA